MTMTGREVGLDTLIRVHESRIAGVLPDAVAHLVGSASVPGLEADDLDLVLVASDVAGAAASLANVYPRLYQQQWDDDWAAFRDPGPPQVDVVVTRPGSAAEARHRLVWDLLRDDARLRAEYLVLKRDRSNLDDRKRAFFERLAASLPRPD